VGGGGRRRIGFFGMFGTDIRRHLGSRRGRRGFVLLEAAASCSWWSRLRVVPQLLAMMAAVEDKIKSTSLGTMPTEMVIRGGMLKGPAVLTGLCTALDKPFVPLRKSDKVLSLFLTGRPSSQRPLAKTLIIETLLTLRNNKRIDLAAEIRMPAGDDAGAMVAVADGLADDLGLDDPAEVLVAVDPVGKRRRGICNRAVLSQLPRTATVSVERTDGTVWEPVLLVDVAHKAPAMECVVANFQALFEIVQGQMSDGTSQRKQHGQEHPLPGSKAPRHHPDGSREYWVRGKWVRRYKIASSTRPALRKYRTLKRKSSDEAAAAARARPRARGRGRKAASLAIQAEAASGDGSELEL
jgi:hypothetical protein